MSTWIARVHRSIQFAFSYYFFHTNFLIFITQLIACDLILIRKHVEFRENGENFKPMHFVLQQMKSHIYQIRKVLFFEISISRCLAFCRHFQQIYLIDGNATNLLMNNFRFSFVIEQKAQTTLLIFLLSATMPKCTAV